MTKRNDNDAVAFILAVFTCGVAVGVMIGVNMCGCWPSEREESIYCKSLSGQSDGDNISLTDCHWATETWDQNCICHAVQWDGMGYVDLGKREYVPIVNQSLPS